jgi:hypothetical protein
MTRKPSKTSKATSKKPAKPKPRPASKSTSKAKAKAKKPEKSLPSKKAAPAPPAAKAKPPKAAAPRGGPAKPAGKPVAKAPGKTKGAKAPAAGGKKKPLVLPTGILKPGFGYKWACFNCGAKFYDLGKPVPVCPKCEADQRDRPPVVASAAPSTPQPKRPSMPPMSRFLDDDEVAAPEPDEFGAAPAADGDIEEPEAAEIDIEALDEPGGGLAEPEFSEAEEE